jgi:hypothetical protein
MARAKPSWAICATFWSSVLVSGALVATTPIVVLVPGGAAAYASRIAVPIWADFVRRAATLRPPASFTAPADVSATTLCSVSHALPTDRCPTYEEYFKSGDSVPKERCLLHGGSLRDRFGRAIGGLFERLKRLFR